MFYSGAALAAVACEKPGLKSIGKWLGLKVAELAKRVGLLGNSTNAYAASATSFA